MNLPDPSRSRRFVVAISAMAALLVAPVVAQDCQIEVRVTSPDGDAIPSAVVSQIGGESVVASAEGVACLPGFPSDDGGSLVVSAEGWSAGTRSVAAEDSQVELILLPAFGEEVVVSATGTAQRLKDLPVHIESIDRRDIVASAARTLAEAVEYTAGLRIESNCGNCNTSQLRMLGLEGPYSQIVVDSQPTVSSLALVYGLEQIPARMLDSIEVLKGSGSAMYGASSIAGTVNLIPHQADHSHVDVDLEATSVEGANDGQGGAVRALLDWGAEDGRRSASVYGQRDEVPLVDVNGDGFSEVTERELMALGVRGNLVSKGDRAQLVSDVNWTDASRRGGDITNFDRPPDQTEVTEAIATTTLAASLRWLYTPNARTDLRLAASRVEIERDSYYGFGFDPNAYGVSDGQTTVLSGQVNHAYQRGTFSWGAQADEDSLFDEQLGYSRVTEQQTDSWSVFAQENRKLGKRVSVLYGARIDAHSALEDEVVSPRGALLFSPRPDFTVRVAYGRGFRPPVTFDEDLHIELVGGGLARVIRSSPELVEETSRSALLSGEWRPTLGTHGTGSFEIAVFDTRLTNLFFNREADDLQTPELELLRVNLGGATVRGIEGTASVRFGKALQFDAGLVSQTARYDDREPDFGSRNFWRTPELYGNFSTRWSPTDRLNVFAGAIYTGEMDAPHYAGFVGSDRLERTESFLTFDLNATYTLPLGGEREIAITVGGKNLTDDFQSDLDRGPLRDSSYVVGPRFPRSWFVTTGFRF